MIVGRRTFGKGLVQRQFPLPDGTMIRLTVARYYTPAGRSIQKPYEEGNIEAYNKDFLNRLQHGEMLHADSIHFPDSLKYTTLINKRVVYGGGGIMPDLFVPIDTTSATPLHRALIGKGVVNRFTIGKVDKNRKSLLEAYPDVDKFKTGYQLSDSDLSDLKKTAEAEGVVWNDEEFEKSKDFLSVQLKALMARDLYDTSAYFKIINDEMDIFNEGLRLIGNTEEYNRLLNPNTRK